MFGKKVLIAEFFWRDEIDARHGRRVFLDLGQEFLLHVPTFSLVKKHFPREVLSTSPKVDDHN